MLGTDEEVITLCVCVARRIHNHDNAMHVAQHNPQYAKLLLRRGYSTVYHAQNNSCTYEIMLANWNTGFDTCFFGQWKVVRDQRCREPA